MPKATRTNKRIDELATSINELFRNAHRPGAAWERKDDDIGERKDAVGALL